MFIQIRTMIKITKKYIFERKLDGKPIIVYVKKGANRWITIEDIKLLKAFGVIVQHDIDRQRCTHAITTYTLPFDPQDRPKSEILKGTILGPARKSA